MKLFVKYSNKPPYLPEAVADSIPAITQGVNRVHILDGRIPHCRLLEIFTNKGIGTALLRDEEKKYSE